MLKKIDRRYLILLTVEILCVLLLLPGCFRKSERIAVFTAENIPKDAGSHAELEIYGEGRSLTVGVYKIKVQADLQGASRMLVQMQGEQAYFKSLRGNGMNIYTYQDYVDFNVYVLGRVAAPRIHCDFFESGPEALIQLEVYRTNLLNRILLVIELVMFGVLNLLIEFRRRVLAGAVSRKKQVVFWTLTAGVFLCYFPYMLDYFFVGADWNFHLTRIIGLADSLKQGTALPVRVQSYWLYDHGYAVPMFYGDFFLFFPAILVLLGFSIMTAYKAFIFVMLAATAYIAYHCLKRCVKDEYAALFGSMTYILMPYHIFNVYNRSAVGECLAMVFLPMVFCGLYLLYTEDTASEDYRKYKWYLIGGLSAILQSHVISTEMTAIFVILVCLIFWKRTLRKQTFLQLAEAAVTVLLINMWFWVPLLYMMSNDVYHLQTITQEAMQKSGVLFAGILQLLPNRGSAQTGMFHCEPIQIGAGALMLLTVFGLWRLCRHRRMQYSMTGIMAVSSVLTIVMSTRYLPWDRIIKIPVIGRVFSSMQFPWRWMVLAAMFTSVFTAFLFLEVKQHGGRLIKMSLVIAAVLGVWTTVYHVNSIAFEQAPIWLYSAENLGTVSVGNGEYLLEEVDVMGINMYYHDPVAENGLVWSDYKQKGTRATIFLENTSEELQYIEIPLLGYKGYQVRTLNGETEIPYIAEKRGTHGDLKIAVPAGFRGDISISYKGFFLFHVAEGISLVSILVICGTELYRNRKRLWKWKLG